MNRSISLYIGAVRLIAGLALGFGGIAAITSASATQIFHPSPNQCGSDNCNAVVLGGTVNSVTGTRAGPWTIEVFAADGQCLRLSLSFASANQDLEMSVVQPNGAVRQDDNEGTPGCANCPVVKFVAPVTGWHSVSISQASGTPVEKDFRLHYGVYKNSNNSNCTDPTPAQ